MIGAAGADAEPGDGAFEVAHRGQEAAEGLEEQVELEEQSRPEELSDIAESSALLFDSDVPLAMALPHEHAQHASQAPPYPCPWKLILQRTLICRLITRFRWR